MSTTGSASNTIGFTEHDHTACVIGALNAADTLCCKRNLRMTRTRRRVLEILLESHAALGAYDVLSRLDDEGLGSNPPVAYRALSFLVENGMVHRIEKLNAFVACAHPGKDHKPVFMWCLGCGTVAETAARTAHGLLGRSARQTGFVIEHAVVEAEGFCPACQHSRPATI